MFVYSIGYIGTDRLGGRVAHGNIKITQPMPINTSREIQEIGALIADRQNLANVSVVGVHLLREEQ